MSDKTRLSPRSRTVRGPAATRCASYLLMSGASRKRILPFVCPLPPGYPVAILMEVSIADSLLPCLRKVSLSYALDALAEHFPKYLKSLYPLPLGAGRIYTFRVPDARRSSYDPAFPSPRSTNSSRLPLCERGDRVHSVLFGPDGRYDYTSVRLPVSSGLFVPANFYESPRVFIGLLDVLQCHFSDSVIDASSSHISVHALTWSGACPDDELPF